MSQPDNNLLKTENRWSDCVLMKLHSAPVESEEASSRLLLPEVRAGRATKREISLNLTIRFYKQSIQVPGGRVEFGLKQGKLELNLTNGKIPLEKMGLTVTFEVEVEVEEQQEEGRESEGAISLAGSFKIKDAHKSTTKTTSKHHQVVNYGTEAAPIWEFQMKPFLRGQLTKTLLGIVEVTEEPCQVNARFTAPSQRDLELLDVSGIISVKHLSRNKTAWATREFFLRFVHPRLYPYLSQVEGPL
jgi:hypothetical protein